MSLESKITTLAQAIGADIKALQAASGVSGPASSVDSNFSSFDGVGGDTLKDSGYGPSDFAAASHGHSGVYEPADSTILRDADIGSTVVGGSTSITVGTTAPSSPAVGDLWVDTN